MGKEGKLFLLITKQHKFKLVKRHVMFLHTGPYYFSDCIFDVVNFFFTLVF